MRRRPGATCWQWGIFQQQFRSVTCGPVPWLQVSLRFAVVGRGRTCPELRGEWVFQLYCLEMAMQNPQTRDLEKWQRLFVLARPSSFLCFFGGAPGFRQNRVFQNGQIFAETTVNVVPNCRGCKAHFCTAGSEIGHVRSGSNIVSKDFFLNWHFLSRSPLRRQGKMFGVSCLFPSCEPVPS